MTASIEAADYLAAAGHRTAAGIAASILESGGNAVDAGVAAGLALSVLQSDIVNFAGVAPILVREGSTGRVFSICGVGGWPRRADVEVFRRDFGGRIPHGILRTVVPAAPAAWITALARFGTLAFGDVAAPAIDLARNGFPMHELMAETISSHVGSYARWASTAAIYLPGGSPPAVGARFVQSDLAGTIRHMADEEKAAAGLGRVAALRRAHDAFYRGDIASAILAYHEAHGGWLGADDLAGHEATIEEPVSRPFGRWRIFTGQPWCQGPILHQLLGVLARLDLRTLGHNSAAYVEMFARAVNLCFADREACFGDPRFVDVPLDRLLSDEHIEAQAERVRRAEVQARRDGCRAAPFVLDTSYVAVVDRHGNALSATPSDSSADTPVIPGTGLCPSSRGSQSWTAAGHPSELAPGKRPRLTPSPAIAIGRDGSVLAFGSPGADVLLQAMAQFLCNHEVFGLALQEAVEAPRFAAHDFPNSFEPHAVIPGGLSLEAELHDALGPSLQATHPGIARWTGRDWRAGAICAVRRDGATGVLTGAADPRRPTGIRGR